MKAESIDTTVHMGDAINLMNGPESEFMDHLIKPYRDGGWSLEEALEDGKRKMNGYPPLPKDVQEANLSAFKARWEETSE